MKTASFPRIKQLWDICWSFLKIAPVTFGGGYAMIPVIEREVVENRRWLREDEMNDVLSIAGSAPGGIGVNAAIFVGYRLAGIAGALAALLGIALPTFLIVLILCITFVRFRQLPKLDAVFAGIQCAIAAMIAVAGYRVGKRAVRDKTTLAVMAAAMLLLAFTPVHPMLVIAFGAAAGYATVTVKEKLGMTVRFEKDDTMGPDGQGFTYKYADYYIGDGI